VNVTGKFFFVMQRLRLHEDSLPGFATTARSRELLGDGHKREPERSAAHAAPQLDRLRCFEDSHLVCSSSFEAVGFYPKSLAWREASEAFRSARLARYNFNSARARLTASSIVMMPSACAMISRAISRIAIWSVMGRERIGLAISISSLCVA